jgi:hypothetical protein
LLGGFHYYTDQWKTGGSGELDYLLGEMHIDATPDSMALSDIKVVPAMAMKAGFTVRAPARKAPLCQSGPMISRRHEQQVVWTKV